MKLIHCFFSVLFFILPLKAEELVLYQANESSSSIDVFAPGYQSDNATLRQESQTSVSAPNDAPDAPLFRASGLQITNNDRVLHNEHKIGVGRGSRNVLQWFGLELFRMEDKADWLHFTNERFIGSFDLRYNPQWMLSTSLGQTQLDLDHFFGRTYHKKRKLDQWRSKLIYTPIPDTEVRVEGSNDFTFMGWTVPDDGRLMTVESLFVEVESFSVRSWQLRTNMRESFFEDHNRQRSFDNLILKEIVTQPFNLKLGVSGAWTQFERQTGDYWSPKHFENYGMRVLIAKEFLRDWWTEARLYHGLHQEKNLLIGRDSAAEFTLQYRSPKGFLAKLILNSYDADGGGFWRDDIGLNLEVPF